MSNMLPDSPEYKAALARCEGFKKDPIYPLRYDAVKAIEDDLPAALKTIAELSEASANAYARGFAECKERAAKHIRGLRISSNMMVGFLDSRVTEEIAKQIDALEPGAKTEEK